MKISGAIGFILLLTFFFFSFGFLVDEFENNYLDTNISSGDPFNKSLIGEIDDTEFLNETIDPIRKSFEDIAEPSGFFDVIGDLAVVLPLAIIKVPGVVLAILNRGLQRSEEILNILGIPLEVIGIVFVGLFIFIIFKLVSWWHRSEV